MANFTTLQIGSYNPLTDVWSQTFDLNDRATTFLQSVDFPQPERVLVKAFNVRTPGELIPQIQDKNHLVTCTLFVKGASTTALLSTYRTILQTVRATPYALRVQLAQGSLFTYADVRAVTIPKLGYHPQKFLSGVGIPITLVFETSPGWRGPRQSLQNLVMNPGIEAPIGNSPAFLAFGDGFATLNAYAVQAGAALGTDKFQYADEVWALTPTRYYRLDEASGTTAIDATGSGNNATYTNTGSLNLAQGSGVNDTGDKSLGFTASGTGYVNVPTSGLPSGTNLWSVALWLYTSATPTTNNATAFMMGNGGGQYAVISWTTAGNLVGGINGVTNGTVSVAAPTTAAWHHVVVTFDGTTVRMYLDGASAGFNTPTSPSLGTGTCAIGAFNNAGTISLTWGGSHAGFLDEVSIHVGSALSSTQVTTLYNDGVNALGTASNTAQLANGNRVSFGSPAWGAYNTWQVRFRPYTGGTFDFYPHYVDANNSLIAEVSGGQLTLFQRVAGVSHTLATTSCTLTNGIEYWLQVIQYPAPATDPPYVQATVLRDATGGSQGTVGAQVAQVAAATFNTTTALVGQPQVAATGAALGLGGNYANVHIVNLWGPGGYLFTGNTGTGPCAAAWDGTRAELGQSGTATAGTQTYGGGPVTSFGAGRVDLAPAGTVDCYWDVYGGGAPGTTAAVPVKAATDVLGLSAWAKSSGLAGTTTIKLEVYEYNAAGSFLRSGVVATLTGNQASWTQLSGTYTTGASCANVDVRVHVADTNAGASANGTVWLDNLQLWDQTSTGLATMAYHEMRFASSPAQMMVSGLLGDLISPAWLAMGCYLASWGPGSTLFYGAGRRAVATAGAQLVAPSHGYYGTTFTPTGTPVVDSTSYGGFYVKATVGTAGWNPRALSPKAADNQGTYHVLTRYRTSDATPTGVQVRAKIEHLLDPWFTDVNTAKSLTPFYGPYTNPLAAAATWTQVDAGSVTLPAFPAGALQDLTQQYVVPRGEWVGTTGGGAEGDAGWLALLPVDGSVVAGVVNNPSNSTVTVTGQFLWVYVDGLLVVRGAPNDGPATAYSLETTPVPNAAHAGGGVGSQTTGPINVNGNAEPYLTLDPTTGGGVNQLVAYLTDGTGTPVSMLAEIQYSPLFLFPQ